MPPVFWEEKLKRYITTFIVAGTMGLAAQCVAAAYTALGLTMPLLMVASMFTLAAIGLILYVTGAFAKLNGLSFVAMLFPFPGLAATVAEGASKGKAQGKTPAGAFAAAVGEILGVLAPGFAAACVLALLRAFVL